MSGTTLAWRLGIATLWLVTIVMFALVAAWLAGGGVFLLPVAVLLYLVAAFVTFRHLGGRWLLLLLAPLAAYLAVLLPGLLVDF